SLDRGGRGAARLALAWPQRLTPHLAGDLASPAGPPSPDAGPSRPRNVGPPGRSLHARLERNAGRALHRAPRSPESGCRRSLVRRRGCSMAVVEMPPPDSTPGLAVLWRSGARGLSMAEDRLRALPDRSLRPALDGADCGFRHGAGDHQRCSGRDRLADFLPAPARDRRAFSRTVRDVIGWRGQTRNLFDRITEVDELPPMRLFWGAR